MRYLFVVTVLFIHSQAFSATSNCIKLLSAKSELAQQVLEQTSETEIKGIENREFWSSELLVQSGLFIVHAFNAFGVSPASENFILQSGSLPEDSILSASLIGLNKSATAGYFGLMLQVPETSILITHSADIGLELDSAYGTEKIIRWFKTKLNFYGVKAPKDIIEKTYPDDYNEVVISTKGAKISGLFVKTNRRGEPLCVDGERAVSDKEISLLEKLSAELNIPITQIPEYGS